MSYFDMVKDLLLVVSFLALPQLAIMAYQKVKHPERIKEIRRIAKWLNYQMFGCGIMMGFIIKLSW
jgi:hypothetical protein